MFVLKRLFSISSPISSNNYCNPYVNASVIRMSLPPTSPAKAYPRSKQFKCQLSLPRIKFVLTFECGDLFLGCSFVFLRFFLIYNISHRFPLYEPSIDFNFTIVQTTINEDISRCEEQKGIVGLRKCPEHSKRTINIIHRYLTNGPENQKI